MKTLAARQLALMAAMLLSLPAVAEEPAHQVLTAVSSTTLSGYVSTSAIWKFGTMMVARGNIDFNPGFVDSFDTDEPVVSGRYARFSTNSGISGIGGVLGSLYFRFPGDTSSDAVNTQEPSLNTSVSQQQPATTLAVTSPNAALAGFWHFVTFNTPNRLTLTRDGSGVVTNIPERENFDASSGTLTVDSSGNFTGTSEEGPFTGTSVFSGQGQVTVSPGDGNQLYFRINDANDFMFAVEEHEQSRGLNFAIRAPSSVVNSEVAGTWNIVFLTTPTSLGLEFKPGTNQVMNIQTNGGFQVASGTLTLLANGTFTGNVYGPVSGTFNCVGNGQVDITVTPQGGSTDTLSLFINASKDTIAGLQVDTNEEDFQEVLIMTRVATSTTVSDLKGHWEIVSYGTPSYLSQIKNGNGLLTSLSGDDFEAHIQRLNVGNNGFFTAQLDGPATGTATVSSPGSINVTLTNSAGEIQSLTFFLNAGKNILTTVANDEINELIVLAKSPPVASPTFPQDLGLISFGATSSLKVYWPGDGSRLLQSSSDLTNWVDVAGTSGQSFTNISTTAITNRYYRLKELPPQ
jgi:hypothetical protein